MVPLTVEYRLPVTVVRFSGVRTSTKISYKPVSEKPTVAITKAAVLEVRADPRANSRRSITVPDVQREDLKVVFKLLDDGRLVSSDTTIDPHNDAAWSAVVKNAALLGAAGASLGPWGAVGGVLIGGISTALVAANDEEAAGHVAGKHARMAADSERADADDARSRIATEQAAITPEMVGVEPTYAREHKDEAELLIKYRVALGRLREAHAQTAYSGAEGLAWKLTELEKSFDSTRRLAQVSEDRYAAWLAEEVSVEKEVVEIQHYLDDLPTEKELLGESKEGSFEHDDKPWWPVVQKLEIMVTCDFVDETTKGLAAPTAPAASDDICYRQPQPAVIQTWQCRPDPDRHGRWLRPVLIERKWALVTLPSFEKRIKAPVASDEKSNVSVGFSDAGALTSITSDVTGPVTQRITAVGDLSSQLSTAVTAGKTLGETFSPSAIEAARLKQAVDIAEARGTLGPAPADPLAEKRKELTEAEIDARIAVAHYLAADPSRVVLVSPTTHTSQ